VHAKVFIVDDDFLRVGSSNLSNRSMGFDYRVRPGGRIDGRRDGIRNGIAKVRARLLGEHLNVEPVAVLEAHRETASLLRAVEQLRGSGRTLATIDVDQDSCQEPSLALSLSRPLVVDPERPIAADELVLQLLPEEVRDNAHRPFLRVGILVTAVLAVAALWRWTPLEDWIRPANLAASLQTLEAHSFGPAIVLAIYAVGSLLLVPVTALNLATALAFRPGLAFACALGGIRHGRRGVVRRRSAAR
jgi:hypothetical protein